MTFEGYAAPAWRFASGERRAVPRSPLPVPTTPPVSASGLLAGRARELDRLARGLVDVPVALIYGLPGIGKSTLAMAHAATRPEAAAYVRLAAGASIAHLVETVQRRLGEAPSRVTLDDAARLDELWTLLDASAALLVLDDLHCLAPGSRSLVLDTAAQRLRVGRLLATSRELVPIRAGGPDRMQLRLDGLDRSDAAQLWERLIELYGPGGDFDAAWQRSLGHPALLRQAHVAAGSGEHPLLALVQSLDPAQRRIAGAMALSRAALPRGIVTHIASTAAVDGLVNRLIAEVTADGGYAMHDVVREAVVLDLGAATRDELRATLVELLVDSELDAVTILGEAARHLRALGRHADVAKLVVTTGGRLVRQGATAALLHEIMREDDPETTGAPSHDRAVSADHGQRLRAHVRALLRAASTGDAPRALSALEPVVPASAEHRFDHALLELARAVLSIRQGRARRGAKHLKAAISLAAECQADPGLIPALYQQLQSEAAAVRSDAAAATPLPPLVIDGIHHEIVDGGMRTSLASRMILRRLLYAFLTAEGHYLDSSAIARALWHCEYIPLRHNSSIKSNIRRLRDLLEGTRAVIQADHAGYRLLVPPDSILVPPRS